MKITTTTPDGVEITVDDDRRTSTFLRVEDGRTTVKMSLFTAGELYSVLSAFFDPTTVEVCTMSQELPVRLVRDEEAA